MGCRAGPTRTDGFSWNHKGARDPESGAPGPGPSCQPLAWPSRLWCWGPHFPGCPSPYTYRDVFPPQKPAPWSDTAHSQCRTWMGGGAVSRRLPWTVGVTGEDNPVNSSEPLRMAPPQSIHIPASAQSCWEPVFRGVAPPKATPTSRVCPPLLLRPCLAAGPRELPPGAHPPSRVPQGTSRRKARKKKHSSVLNWNRFHVI